MQLDEPKVIKLDSMDEQVFTALRELCIGQDMLHSESYVSPFTRAVFAPLYSSFRFLARSVGMGLPDVTSMHPYYDDAHFIRLATAAWEAAERETGGELSLVTALTHKAKRGEFSSWHNGYYSPYIYNDDADVLSAWIPLQSVSPGTGSGFRFWYGDDVAAKAKQLCGNRWRELDARPRGRPTDIMSPGKELRAFYKFAGDSDRDGARDRCTRHAELGEAILFNEYWPHMTTKWVGDGVRLSIVLRFVRKGTGLNKARLNKRKQALKLNDAEWTQYCTYISSIESGCEQEPATKKGAPLLKGAP